MAKKRITLDVEAYGRLMAARRGDESFSETIKRVVPDRPRVESWLSSSSKVKFSEEFVEAVEEQIKSRARPSRRSRKAG
jgi:predicted CopG family antitoxin